MPLPELSAWVARARKGDRAAFEKLVHVTARMVYAQVVAGVRDRQKAEDITQEAFVAAWNGIGSWQPPVEEDGGDTGRSFVSWLLTVARHTMLDSLKRERRQKRGGGAASGGRKWFVGRDRDSRESAAGEKRAAEGSGGLVGEVADDAPEPAEAAAGNEAQVRALEMLAELPEEYRRVLAMRYLAGADYATIREQLGLTDGALRGILSRGMALLRERMTRVEK